jgi:fucose 4-O-acetylase-like acetyltransferase
MKHSVIIDERLSFLDSLRFIAIIMVIGVHTLGYCVELPKDTYRIIAFVVHTIPVPVFFFVDGYLFARKVTNCINFSALKMIKKSAFRLLVPWLIFTISYTFIRFLFELSNYPMDKLLVNKSVMEILISAYGSVYASQMYFLISLFFIRVCSPIFRKVVSINSFKVLIVLFLGYYIIYRVSISTISLYITIENGQEPLLHALWGLQFYFFGIIIFKSSIKINIKSLFIPLMFFFIFAIALQYKMEINWIKYVVQYLYLIIVFLFFSICADSFHFLSLMGKNTMGIYLIHTPIILKVVSLILNYFIINPILSFLTILLSTLILTICIVYIIMSVPHGRLLFGMPYRIKSEL